MILYLYSINDANAIWLKNQLLTTLNEPNFVAVSDYDLINKVKIELFLKNDVQNFNLIYNQNIISSNSINKCINLIPFLQQFLFSKYTKTDSEYVSQEWHSIFLAILRILQEKIIFNTPVPFEFCGRKIELDECLLSANKAGINTFPLHRNKDGANYFKEFKQTVQFEILFYDSEIYCDSRIKALMPIELQAQLLIFVKLLNLKIAAIQLCYFQKKFYFLGLQNQYCFENYPNEFLLNLKKNILTQI